MNELVWTKRFIKSVRQEVRKNPDLADKLDKVFTRLKYNPYDTSLKTHKLHGNLSGALACSVEFNFRIVFEIQKTENPDIQEILLLSCGTHDEIY